MTQRLHRGRTIGLITLDFFVVVHLGTGNKAVGLEKWDIGNKTLDSGKIYPLAKEDEKILQCSLPGF